MVLALVFMLLYCIGARGVSALSPAAAAAAAAAWLHRPTQSLTPPPPLHTHIHSPPSPPACAAQARGIVSFVLDAIWTIFWLAAAACVSNILASGFSTSDMKASGEPSSPP